MTILVADGVRLTREGLVELLRSHSHHAVPSSADPAAIGDALAATRVDLAVCNAATVDLGPAVAAIRSSAHIPIIAMSVSETVADVARCAGLGLAGFVLADDGVEDLLHLVATADIGRSQCPAHAVHILMQLVRSQTAAQAVTARLTEREDEIATMLQDGLANKEIARRLGITQRTVKNHLHHVYAKLGVHTRGEVVALLRHQRSTFAPA